MSETTPRESLVAMVTLMGGLHDGFDAAWKRGEAFVAGLEAEPDKPVKCPCCTKLVVCCTKHYLLHEPGKLCSGCREDE